MVFPVVESAAIGLPVWQRKMKASKDPINLMMMMFAFMDIILTLKWMICKSDGSKHNGYNRQPCFVTKG
jgi:hypothetical protein